MEDKASAFFGLIKREEERVCVCVREQECVCVGVTESVCEWQKKYVCMTLWEGGSQKRLKSIFEQIMYLLFPDVFHKFSSQWYLCD